VLAREHADRLYREAFGRAVGVLARAFGDLDLAEDCVQDAFAAGLERWPREGVPRDVTGWIVTVARHRALDRIRRSAIGASREQEAAVVAAWRRAAAVPEEASAVPDERLRTMFVCCHPALPMEGRVALTLRLVAGLRVEEIARALLARPEAVAQRLVRAKRTLREAGVGFGKPADSDLPERLASVLAVLYLVFNEGYAATAGDAPVRAELCDEAIRLARVLVALMPDEPEPVGLLATMLLHDARRAARHDARGRLIRLEDHDRRLYDRARVAEGLDLLLRATRLQPSGRYALEAAIAGAHDLAPDFASTPWPEIAALYARLAEVAPSPIVELNRAVALSYAEAEEPALALVEGLANELDGIAAYHATRAELLRRLARLAEARAAFARAAELATNPAERDYLACRAEALAAAG
jgi:RNA polymerase sigma-70 factor (ECF subfamily)